MKNVGISSRVVKSTDIPSNPSDAPKSYFKNKNNILSVTAAPSPTLC
jgi:hypothetical protein